MKWRLQRCVIEQEDDIVAVRHRARWLAERLGLSRQDQTGLATAVSEIARNAYGYATGGVADFGIAEDGPRQSLVVRISDKGPGIDDLETILGGRYRSTTGMGLGIVGSRRLVDHFDIRSAPGQGTAVSLHKRLSASSPRLDGAAVQAIGDALAEDRASDARFALRDQNRELIQSLSDLADKEEEARQLNAELLVRSEELREARDDLERRVVERTTELAASNAKLREEAALRERIEGELQQAQKMDAVGQLTSGIAHDFNNLLTGITGSLDLLRSRLAQGRTDRSERYIETAVAAANRAAALTHRLLAFSRPQPIAPQPTDANAVVHGLEELLRRTITSAIAFRIVTTLDVWTTLCDPHQLENAILNLCVNARDAMPDGGTLTIETANTFLDARYAERHPNAKVGDHVVVAVQDTGTGMPPEVVARVFEPFFTTKPVGKGTGLGLAMIYGFARQSGGHCRIESEVGEGTRILLYLPRMDRAAAETQAAASSRAQYASADQRGEHILVVEQNHEVRSLILEVLTDHGYLVETAEDALAAQRMIAGDKTYELVLTDIGLPGGMSGLQLEAVVATMRPELPFVFITGYADGAEASAAGLRHIVSKPFKVDVFLAKIASLLRS